MKIEIAPSLYAQFIVLWHGQISNQDFERLHEHIMTINFGSTRIFYDFHTKYTAEQFQKDFLD